MNHVLIGAGVPLAVALVLYGARRHASLPFLIGTPLAMVAGAVWAVVPDIPRLLGPRGHILYRRLNSKPWTDVFFFHYTIDRLEDAWLDPLLIRFRPALNMLFALMLMSLLALAWRELAKIERQRSQPD